MGPPLPWRATRSCGSCRWRCVAAGRTRQLFGGSGVIGLEADEGFGHFSPFLVRDGDDGDFGDGGVIGQRLLDFNGGDDLAAGDDDVLHAVAQLVLSDFAGGGAWQRAELVNSSAV